MKKVILSTLSVAALALLAACSNGSEPAAGPGPNSQARSTAFKSMMPSFSTMGKMVKGDEAYDAEKFKQAAATFAVDGLKPFEHFAQDGEGKDGDALPNIWSDATKFEATKTEFTTAVAKLNETAQTGKLEDIKAAYGAVGNSCKACHDSFRKPK